MFSEEVFPNDPFLVTLSSEMVSYIILENIHHAQPSLFCVYSEYSFQTKIVFKEIYKLNAWDIDIKHS